MLDINHIYMSAFILRLVLLLFGEWQDSHMEVKFTDVDYYVFTDAAEFVTQGMSPYHRATYRYSPLLAWMLTPNLYLHQTWGKLLFICTDILTAFFIQFLLRSQNRSEMQVKLGVSIWLFNPVTAAVSCRGNAESLMAALVLSVLYFLKLKFITLAGVMFALAIHLKIYPVVYSVALFLFLRTANPELANYTSAHGCLQWRDIIFVKKVLNERRNRFALGACITFCSVTLLMYVLYGWEFLEHTYLYHLSRRDIRHNFSVYFYMLYTNVTAWLGIFCFFNQLAVIIIVSFFYFSDLPFCLFLLTYAFVAFNKICTSQYFLWYLSLFPCVAAGHNHLKWTQWIIPVVAWFLSQALWLAPAYKLEFEGFNSFFLVWLSGLLFFVANSAILCFCVKHYVSQSPKNLSKNLKDD